MLAAESHKGYRSSNIQPNDLSALIQSLQAQNDQTSNLKDISHQNNVSLKPPSVNRHSISSGTETHSVVHPSLSQGNEYSIVDSSVDTGNDSTSISDLLSPLRKPSPVSNISDTRPATSSYVAKLGAQGTGVRDYQERLNEAHNKSFGNKLKHFFAASENGPQLIYANVHKHMKARDELNKRLRRMLGSYSYFLLEDMANDLSRLRKSAFTQDQVRRILKKISSEIDSLFDLLDIYIVNKKQIKEFFDIAKSIKSKDVSESSLKEMLADWNEKDLSVDEPDFQRASLHLEKRLKVLDIHEATRGNCRKLREGLKKLSREINTTLGHSRFQSSDILKETDSAVTEMRDKLRKLSSKNAHSTKDYTSTIDQPTVTHSQKTVTESSTNQPKLNVSAADKNSALSNIPYTHAGSSQPQRAPKEEKRPTELDEPAQLPRDRKKNSRSTELYENTNGNREYAHRPVRGRTYKTSHQRRFPSLSERVRVWNKKVIADKTIDATCKRFSIEIEHFLRQLEQINGSSENSRDLKTYKTLKESLSALKSKIQDLQNGHHSSTFKQFLKSMLYELDRQWQTCKHILSPHTIVPTPIEKPKIQGSLIAATYTSKDRVPKALPKNKQTVNEEPKSQKLQGILRPDNYTSNMNAQRARNLQQEQIEESLKMSGVKARSEMVDDKASSVPASIMTRSYGHGTVLPSVIYPADSASAIQPRSGKVQDALNSHQRNSTESNTLEHEAASEPVSIMTRSYGHQGKRQDRYSANSVSTIRPESSKTRDELQESRGRVIVTKENKFLWFTTSTKQVNMPETLYKQYYGSREFLNSTRRFF